MEIAVALIGVAGVLAAAVLAEYLRRRQRRPSDKEALGMLLGFLGHKAWRQAFNPISGATDYDGYKSQLSRTKKGIATGRFEDSNGELLDQGVALGRLRDPELRSELRQVQYKLDELETRVDRCRELRAGGADQQQLIAEVTEIERLRREIVETLNRQAARWEGLEPLEQPQTVLS